MLTVPIQLSRNLLIIHHNHHPDPHLLITSKHGRAVDPSRLALEAHWSLGFGDGGGVGEPADFGRDAGAVGEGVEDSFADVLGAADAVEEFGLQEARDAEGGGGEGYAEGGVWADEEVLCMFYQQDSYPVH